MPPKCLNNAGGVDEHTRVIYLKQAARYVMDMMQHTDNLDILFQKYVHMAAHVLCVLALVSAVGLSIVPYQSSGQTTDALSGLRIDGTIAATGIDAVHDGRYEQGARLLASVFEEDRRFTTDQGAVGYWLGHALYEMGADRGALRVWHQTITALSTEDPEWIAPADALIRTTFATRTHTYYEVATQTYLTLLEQAEKSEQLEGGVREKILQHVLEAAFILPAQIKQRIGIDPATAPKETTDLTLYTEAGQILTAWWRTQDARVASPSNERLMEHLTRVAHARDAYMTDGYVDARGRVYIRLGPPPITLDVTFADNPDIQREIIRFSNTISSFDFSPGLYWEYDNIGTEAHFLFVEEREGVYEPATVLDMIPRQIRSNFTGQSRRARQNTYSFLRSMEVALRQLSVYNPRYMERYAEVENYIAYLQTGGGVNFETPAEQAVRVNQQSTREDHRLQRVRRESVGASRSRIEEEQVPIEVEKRWARFLEEDGHTRTEMYWSAPTDDLDPVDVIDTSVLDVDPSTLPARSRIITSMRVEDRDHRAGLRVQQSVEVTSASETIDGWLIPQTTVIQSTTDPFHVGVQWDQRLGATAEEAGNFLLRQSTARVDTLRSLHADADRLEMSDIKPVWANADSLAAGTAYSDLTPYARRQVSTTTPIGLYFEIYHLQADADGQARYTVDLEVDRTQPRSGVARWLRSDESLQTTTTTTNETDRARVDELFLIDISAWEDIAAREEVTITVRVTDEVRGDTRERSLRLDLEETR